MATMGMAGNLQINAVGRIAACHLGLMAQQNVHLRAARPGLLCHGLHIGWHPLGGVGVAVLLRQAAIGGVTHARDRQFLSAHIQHPRFVGQIVQVQAVEHLGPCVIAAVVLMVAGG